jgi:hypothetical protein
MAALAPAVAPAAEETTRQEAVRERGAEVMPFALDHTVHQFEKDLRGGVQRVSAKPGHEDEVAAIRAHLREIAEQFARHDFSAPAQIHGEEMPGLAELRAASAEELRVTYRELPDGAEVRYVGTTQTVTNAIHHWFDAQVGDHGHDAMDHLKHHHKP